jgi:hypothetical protein
VRNAPLSVVTSAVKRSINPMTGPVLAGAAIRRSRRGASGTASEVARCQKRP